MKLSTWLKRNGTFWRTESTSCRVENGNPTLVIRVRATVYDHSADWTAAPQGAEVTEKVVSPTQRILIVK